MIFAKNINNTVRTYNSLPTNYEINGIRHNLRVLPIETVNAEGFYEVVIPTITQYQRLENLIPSDLVGNQWIQRVYNFTQQEIDDYDQEQIDNAIDAIVNTYEADGRAFFVKLRRKIREYYDDGNITQAQYKNIRTSLQPVIQPLRYGDWDVAQDEINAISRPAGQMGVLYDFLKNKIDQYIIDNY
jgi:tRNA(Ser,Leu) C12 N-acetylase TAN1